MLFPSGVLRKHTVENIVKSSCSHLKSYRSLQVFKVSGVQLIQPCKPDPEHRASPWTGSKAQGHIIWLDRPEFGGSSINCCSSQTCSNHHFSQGQISSPAGQMTQLHTLDLACEAPNRSGNLIEGWAVAVLIATALGAIAINSTTACYTDKFPAPWAGWHCCVGQIWPTGHMLVTCFN